MKLSMEEGGTSCRLRIYLVMFHLVMTGLVVAVCGDSVRTSSVQTPAPPPPTLAPGFPANLTLELEARSPAVLDSLVHFKAQMKKQEGGNTDELNFRYEWTDTAGHIRNSTSRDFNTTFNQTYRDPLLAGQYLMTVVVFKHSNRTAEHLSLPPKIITYGNVRFDLTEHLNGDLDLYQDLEYQRNPFTFAVEKVLMLQCNLSDVFSSSQNPSTVYKWNLPNYPSMETTVPVLNMSQLSPINATVGVKAVVKIQVPVTDPQATGHLATSAPILVTKTRKGTFEKLLVFKAPLERVDIQSDKSVAVGDTLFINVSAYGSPPTSVCWGVTKKGVDFHCTPRNFTDTTWHTINVTIPVSGWHSVQLMVYNDVSFKKGKLRVFVYAANSVNLSAVVIPIVCICVAFVVIAIGAANIVQIRKRTSVETANFDFHPNITQPTTQDKVLRVLVKVREFFSARDQSQWHRRSVNNDKWTSSSEESSYQQSVQSSYQEI